jgi:hypothetical protein
VDAAIKAIALSGKVRTILPMAGIRVLLDGTPDGRLLVMHDGFSAAMYFHRPSGADTDLYWHDMSLLRDHAPPAAANRRDPRGLPFGP